jgi:hypothetical protein
VIEQELRRVASVCRLCCGEVAILAPATSNRRSHPRPANAFQTANSLTHYGRSPALRYFHDLTYSWTGSPCAAARSQGTWFTMTLRYPPFAASSQMAAASRNAPPLRWGTRGTAVGLLQGGLISSAFPCRVRSWPKARPTRFRRRDAGGSEEVSRRTQGGTQPGRSRRQGHDCVDGQLAGRCFEAAPFHAPPLPSPVTTEYELGRGDPPIQRDAGSGRWNSSPKEVGTWRSAPPSWPVCRSHMA